MTQPPSTQPASFSGFGDNRDEILSRAQDSQLKTHVQDLHDGNWRLAVEFPDDSNVTALTISPRAALELSQVYFEGWQVIGHYQAIYDPSSELIEARIGLVRDAALAFAIPEFFSFVDGFEQSDDDSADLHDSIDKPALPASFTSEQRLGSRWQLKFTHDQGDNLSVELNSGSVRSLVVSSDEASIHDEYKSGRLVAIQINGVSTGDPLGLLEEITSRVFFELQVKYGAPLSLNVRPSWRTVIPFAKSRTQPRLTTNQYRKDAIALYLFGHSLSKVPTNQYLAYYQSIECFFTEVVNADLVAKIKREVSDPRFDPADRVTLTKLATMIQANGPKALSEREQLNRVIARCIDSVKLVDFFYEVDERCKFFLKRDKLGGDIPTIRVKDRNPDELVPDVANRIYDIRCRIVHTKADRTAELRSILPSSAASRDLQEDIQLVRLVAEETILGAATTVI